MPVNIARLRFWIVALGVLLLTALICVFGYARYKSHRLIGDLPGKLGMEVSRESNGFTYSQSVKGRTAFTIHASKAVQYKASNLTLHDVVITLYGAQGGRSDRIAGSEFDYNQKAGIVTAKGEVQIDLQGVAGSAMNNLSANNLSAGTSLEAASSRTKSTAIKVPGPAQGNIHVKTSGLVFNQNTQLAATSQYVEFSTPKGSGNATGASYDVPNGLLVLDSSVALNSDRNGVPIRLEAAHAEFLRGSMQAFLLRPVSTYQGRHGAADQATVHFRRDGSAEHIDAQGHIHLKSEQGEEVTAGKARILLDQRSQPQRAEASGGLSFASSGETGQMNGNAVEGTLQFGTDGALSHAQARNAVSFVDRQRGLKDDPQASATRELRASQMDVDFARDDRGRAIPAGMLAAGGATAVLHTIRTKGAAQNTTIRADQLSATLRGGRAIAGLHGNGHTSVLDVSPSGATSLSTGDTLQVNFASSSASGKSPAARPDSGADGARIQSAIQEGNVVITQTPAAGSATGRTTPTRVTARRADFDAATQILRLTGSPRIDDGATNITADSIDYNREMATAHATGSVKATYLQAPAKSASAPIQSPTAASGIGGGGATHVVAATAVLDQARGLALFRGQARLWQGANSVSAPVIELTRNPETLKAYAEPAANDAVTTVMAAATGAQSQPGVFRVRSRRLTYDDSLRTATFSGSVTAEQAGGTMHADQVQAFLAPPSTAGKAASSQQTAGRVDRIVATGHIELQQPGRRGTGEKLLYTGLDGRFVLTGTSASPPRIYDQAHGNVTGDSLIFNSRDDSVSVTGEQSRAITETRTAR